MAKYGLSDVYFGGDNLSEILKTQILKYDLMQVPDSVTSTARIAMTHKSSSSRYFTAKPITVQFVTETQDSDITELEAILARLRVISQTRWRDLNLVAGILTNNAGEWEYDSDNLTWHDTRIADFNINLSGKTAIITITFIADNPIGYANIAQELFSDSGVTAAELTYDLSDIDIQGTFYLQTPKFTLEINSVTLGADPSFTISNGFANLVYTGTIEAGDVFIIDTNEVQVLRNGNEVDFDGALPLIDLETTPELVISRTYSALNYDILIDNNAGYI